MSKSYKKINFRKSDFFRVLLTDTLPYEVPLPFSNDGFYTRIRKNSINRLDDEIRKHFFEVESFTIPYNYRIRKDVDSDRSLSVIHPATQRRFCDFYARYDSLIIGLCSRSTFSIRRPKRVASRYFEKSLGFNASSASSPSVETEHDGFSKQSKIASSYFSYHRYGLVHRFYDSMEFINIEKKFKHLRTLDISKCFHHIYTHTIAWSVKNKKYAKKYRGESFENQFDKLMQHSNYNETNGIVIGPEISRIFAEVIFQKIDLRVKITLTDLNLHEDREYVIRRYVDDFFVFSNDEDHLNTIEDVVSDALGEYKLYLNASKTINLDRPFTSSISAAKGDAAKLVERIFEQLCGVQSQSEGSTSTTGTAAPLTLTPIMAASNTTLPNNIDLSINTTGIAETSIAIAETFEATPIATGVASPIAPVNLISPPTAPPAAASTAELFPRAGARWPKAIRSVDGLAVTYIKEIKNMILSNKASFDNIATYLNSGILRRLDKMFRGATYRQCNEKSARHAADFLFLF
ncbi:antiviral reverse transcriptase Drt3b [Paraburkholderia sp. BL21I4N1]|uniref:antiviral reverse transcriptase Drt3b n=1 Tax=Paraburkholderia sp. BL21I4N1 TaxID=1938801 RepID=UPI000CFB5B72|nr:antiviral reverse transcriptase Drt3b [Paraburkholderia sp. BL21I4N1]PQV54621.1 reverse transcriptase (RNA-dependent DNA polymerase) [Paraburkholderia sp. BL21I4N1]